MSTGYTKQSSYENGNVISATLFNNDFNKLQDAFAYSSTDVSEQGHTHDGTTGGGGAISKIGDLDFKNKVEIDGSSDTIKMFVEVLTVATEVLNVTGTELKPTVATYGLGTVANPFSTANITTVTATNLTVDTDTLYVDSVNNRVGIGTTSPDFPLHLKNTNPKLAIQDTDGTNQYGTISHSAGDTTIVSRNDTSMGSIVFSKSNGTTTTASMLINSSGNVGIGINPSARLHVAHSSSVPTGIITSNNVNSEMAQSFVTVSSNGGDITLTATPSNYTTVAAWQHSGVLSTDSALLGGLILHAEANDIKFQTGSAHTEQMRITSTGKVGIGNDSPEYTLDIEADTAQARIHSTVGNSVLRLESVDDGESKIYFADNAVAAVGTIEYHHNTNHMSFATVATTRMLIDSSGNVLIGHTDPDNVDTDNGAAFLASGVSYFTRDGGVGAAVEVTRKDPSNGHKWINFEKYISATDSHQSIGSIKQYAESGMSVSSPQNLRLESENASVLLYADGKTLELTSSYFKPQMVSDSSISLGSPATSFNSLYLNGDIELENESTSTDTHFITFKNDNLSREAYIRADYNSTENGNGTGLTIATNPSQGTSVERLKISENGDITFFAEDGTTSGIFWDASAKQLGLNTTSLVSSLNVDSADADASLATFGSTAQTDTSRINLNTDTAAASSFIASYGSAHATEAGNMTIQNTETDGDLFLVAGGNEGIRIDTDGNVGIKNNDPSEALDVTGNIAVSGTVDGVDIATLNSNVVVDGDFTTAGIMTTDGSGNYSVDANTYLTAETSHSDVVVDGDFTSAGIMTTDGSGGYSVDASTYLTTHQDITGKANLSGADFTGNVTTTGTLATGGYTLASTDGTNGQALVTDGSGNVSFGDVTVDVSGKADLSGANFTGNIATTGTIATGGFTLPSTDGTNGQVLATDGSGNMAFADVNVDGDFGSQAITTTNDISAGPFSATYNVNSWQLRAQHNSQGSPASIQIIHSGAFSTELNKNVKRIQFVGTYSSANNSVIELGEIEVLTRIQGLNEIRMAAGALKSITCGKSGVTIGNSSYDPLPSIGAYDLTVASSDSQVLKLHNTGSTGVQIQSLTENTGNTNLLDFQIKGHDSNDNAVNYASITSDVSSNLTANPQANINLNAFELNLKGSNIYMDSLPSLKGKDTSTLNSASARGVIAYNTYEDDDKGKWTTSSQDTSWYKADLNTSVRGGTRDFPSLASIVITSNRIYIHDATKDNNPLWMEIPIDALKPTSISCFFGEDEPTMRNGKLLVTMIPSASETDVIHAALIDFAEDLVLTYRGNDVDIGNSGNLTASSYTLNQNIAGIGSSFNGYSVVTSTLGSYSDLPTGQVSARTGLPKAIVTVGGSGVSGVAAAISYVNETSYAVGWYYQSAAASTLSVLKPNDRGTFTYGISHDDNSTAFSGPIARGTAFETENSKSLQVYDSHTAATLGSPPSGGGVQNTNAVGDSTNIKDITGNLEVLSYTDNTIGLHKELTSNSSYAPLTAAKITSSGISGWVDRYCVRTVFADTVSEGTGTVSLGSDRPLLSTPRKTALQASYPAFTIPATAGGVRDIQRSQVATGADLLGYQATGTGTTPVITSSSGSSNLLNLDTADGFTVSMWIKPTAITAGVALCKIGLDSGNQLQIKLSADRVVEVYHKTSGTTFSSAIAESFDSITLGEWNCISVTRDKQSSIIKIYVNGNLSGFEYYNTYIGANSAICQIFMYENKIYSLFKISRSYLGNDRSNEIIFKDERQLFEEGAKCELDGTSPYRVAYNKQTGAMHVANNSEYAEYRGLVRTTTDTSSGLASTTKGLSSVSNITIGE